MKEALATYSEIESKGGWPALPQKASLSPGAKSAMVSQLRRRLVLSGDLAAEKEKGDLLCGSDGSREALPAVAWPSENGAVGPQTLRALNVPASKRVLQLRGSLHRLSDTDFTFARRYTAALACRTCVSSRCGSCPTWLAGRALISTSPSPRKIDWRSSCRDECHWLGSTSPAGRRMMAKCSSGMTSMILMPVMSHLSEANCVLLASPVHIWTHDKRGGTFARPGGARLELARP
jgi:hypothetical protein